MKAKASKAKAVTRRIMLCLPVTVTASDEAAADDACEVLARDMAVDHSSYGGGSWHAKGEHGTGTYHEQVPQMGEAAPSACPSCGQLWADHPGIAETCRRYRRLAEACACVPAGEQRRAEFMAERMRGRAGK